MGEGAGGEEKVLQFSPFFASIFPLFPQKRLQAKEGDNLCTMLQSVCCLFHAKSCRLSDREKSDVLLII